MSIVEEIERKVAGHKPTDHVAVPVSMMREIAGFYRAHDASLAQLAAASAIGDIGASLAR